MAHVAHTSTTSHKHTVQRPDSAERRLRQVSIWILLYLVLQAELGLAWDRQWHDLVGRDRFWIPPHIMIYSGLGLAGLIALGVVLADTIRYWRKMPGVDENSTIRVLWFFYAPLGFVLLGFGALIDLAAAPLDNYWHELYGIDVTLWSPFHIMGTIGGVIAGLGLAYAFASEAARERETPFPVRRFLGFNAPEWGTLILLAAFMELTLPPLTAFATVVVGPLSFATYALPLACVGSGCLIAAVQLTRKPGAATLTVLLLWLEDLLTRTFVPWALRTVVPALGLDFRLSGRQPVFDLTLALMPLLFLIFAFFIDGIAYRQFQHSEAPGNGLHHVWMSGTLVAIPATFVPPGIVLGLKKLASLLPLPAMPPDISKVFAPDWPSILLALPFALVIGAIAGILGASLGDIWHLNRR